MAFSREQTIQIYEDLADGYDRQHQPRMRDLFLMLAADACLRGSQGDKAELFRRRLLDVNPNHRLKPYASFAEACQYPEVKRELEELRAKYPPEVAQQLLESLWELHDEGEQTGALAPRVAGPRPSGLESPPAEVPLPPEPYGSGPRPSAEEDEEEATLMGSARDFLPPRSPPLPDVPPVRPGPRPKSEADVGHPSPPSRPTPPTGGLPRPAAAPPVPPAAPQPAPFNVPLPPPPPAVPPRPAAPPRTPPRAAEEAPRGYRVPEAEQTQPPPRRPPPREPAEEEVRQPPRRPTTSGQPPTSLGGLGAAPAPRPAASRPAPPVPPPPAAPRPVSAPLPAPLPEPRYAPPLPAPPTTPEELEHPGAWVSALLFVLTLALALALTGLTLVWPLL